MKITRAVSAMFAAVASLSLGTAAQAISLDFVNVGNTGNANDVTGYGSVSDPYAIGKYEVTLLQYTAFLNAVAQTDTYNLYHPSMATYQNIAGIQQNGASGNYSYSLIGDGNRPVTYVSWFDAARFTNWLQNGQGSGDTETGAYALNGVTSGVILKNTSAKYWIPSENEWYKAAYYDPALSGTGGYWLYPTRSNTQPDSRNGSVSNANSANFYYDDGIANGYNGGYAVTDAAGYSGSQNYLTNVGAFTQSASAYGTFDQGGNAREWNDAVVGSLRGLRGGSWNDASTDLRSYNAYNFDPTVEGSEFGFRVATAVPEPGTFVSLIFGAGVLALWRKRSV